MTATLWLALTTGRSRPFDDCVWMDVVSRGRNTAITPTRPPMARSLPLSPRRASHACRGWTWDTGGDAGAGPGSCSVAMTAVLPTRCRVFHVEPAPVVQTTLPRRPAISERSLLPG